MGAPSRPCPGSGADDAPEFHSKFRGRCLSVLLSAHFLRNRVERRKPGRVEPPWFLSFRALGEGAVAGEGGGWCAVVGSTSPSRTTEGAGADGRPNFGLSTVQGSPMKYTGLQFSR